MGGPGSGPKRKPGVPNRGWRDLYSREHWRKLSRFQRHVKSPVCEACLRRGIVRPAEVADHVREWYDPQRPYDPRRPELADLNAFWNGELQSLCRDCHASKRKRGASQQQDFQPGCDENGMPLDPRHPVYRLRGSGD